MIRLCNRSEDEVDVVDRGRWSWGDHRRPVELTEVIVTPPKACTSKPSVVEVEWDVTLRTEPVGLELLVLTILFVSRRHGERVNSFLDRVVIKLERGELPEQLQRGPSMSTTLRVC